jgi:hypothetical protein
VLSGAVPVGYYDSLFNGHRLPQDWRPPAFTVHGERNRPADIVAWRGASPLLSERAVEVFEAVAPGCAEYKYFADIRKQAYFVMNVLATEDVLDTESTIGDRDDFGQFGSIESYRFKDKPLASRLFKLTGRFYELPFVTRAIPEAVVANALVGFVFRDPSVSATQSLFLGKETNVFPGVLT